MILAAKLLTNSKMPNNTFDPILQFEIIECHRKFTCIVHFFFSNRLHCFNAEKKRMNNWKKRKEKKLNITQNRNTDFHFILIFFSTHEQFDLVTRIFKSGEKIARFSKICLFWKNWNKWNLKKRRKRKRKKGEKQYNKVGNKCGILCTVRSLYGAHTHMFPLQVGRFYQSTDAVAVQFFFSALLSISFKNLF